MFLQIMPSVKFFIRSNNDIQGSHVLYLRVSYNGSNAEISLREKINPLFWNQTLQKAKTPSKPQTQFINFVVESYTYKIKALFLDKDYRHASARQILKDVFHQEKKEPLVSEIIKKYITAQTSAKYETIRNHQIKEKNFLNFENSLKMNFVASSFTPVFANRFIEWYKTTKKTENNNSAIRTALFIRTVLQWALNTGIIDNFALANYTAKKDKTKDPVFITRLEFEKMYSHKCESDFHERIKDLFLFQCLTGLSYTDLWSWKTEVKNEEIYLLGQRNKNGHFFKVPLDLMALELLKKYDGKLPIYANIVYNRVLKLIAQEIGIEKYLTTHIGRKTFATLQDGKGWSKESIALMLGHKSIRTTETYYIGTSFERMETEIGGMKQA